MNRDKSPAERLEQIQALLICLEEKWLPAALGRYLPLGTADCQCCRVWLRPGEPDCCRGCPVEEAGFAFCAYTPYEELIFPPGEHYVKILRTLRSPTATPISSAMLDEAHEFVKKVATREYKFLLHILLALIREYQHGDVSRLSGRN